MQLVWPAAAYLDGYVAALRRGWSPDNIRPEAGQEELARIEADPARFLDEQVDREAKGPPIVTSDGTTLRRIPGYRRWIWDGEFCGVIGFRWQPGTAELPPYVLGHIGLRWSRGSEGAVMRRERSSCSFPTREPRDSSMSS